MTKTFRSAMPAMILILITLVACVSLETSPPAAATATATLTPALPMATAAAPTRAMPTSAATGVASDPLTVVQTYHDAWARGASNDVVNLFAENMEYRSIALDTTSRLVLSWHVEFWMATNGKMRLERCDPPRGDTIRCDLVYASDCERLTGFGPWHWDTTFTIKHGKIEKAVAAKMGPGEEEKLGELNRTVPAWAAAHLPDDFARYNAWLASDEWGAQEAGALARQFCVAYGAALTPTPSPTAAP
jgi:hypothetical protein